MFGGVGGEGDGPESVVVSSLRMIEKELPRLTKLVAFNVQLVE